MKYLEVRMHSISNLRSNGKKKTMQIVYSIYYIKRKREREWQNQWGKLYTIGGSQWRIYKSYLFYFFSFFLSLSKCPPKKVTKMLNSKISPSADAIICISPWWNAAKENKAQLPKISSQSCHFLVISYLYVWVLI